MTNDGPFFRRSNGETPFPEQPYITIAYKLTSASVSDAKNGSIINLTFTSVCSFIFFFFSFFLCVLQFFNAYKMTQECNVQVTY